MDLYVRTCNSPGEPTVNDSTTHIYKYAYAAKLFLFNVTISYFWVLRENTISTRQFDEFMPQGFGLTDILGSLLSLQLNSKGSHTGNAFLCRTSVLVCKQLTIHYFSWRGLLTLFWKWLPSQAIYMVMLLNWSTLWVLQPLDTVTVSKIPSDVGCKIDLILKLLRGRCKSYSHGAQGAQDWLMGLHGCECARADRFWIMESAHAMTSEG